MSMLEAAILGAVQGLTEFLPVSSTGHLIVARDILGISAEHGLAFDAILHLATAAAVLIYFRKDIVRLISTFFKLVSRRDIEKEDKTLFWALFFGTLPAVTLGILFQDQIETVFRTTEFVAYALIAGSVLIWFAEWMGKQNSGLTARKGFRIGFFQALALVPGISRSGAAISGGLLMGLTREKAARFAFLLSFPVILGVGILKLGELSSSGAIVSLGTSLLIGAIVAFVTGFAAIHYLLKYLRSHSLGVFVVYRLALAVFLLMIF